MTYMNKPPKDQRMVATTIYSTLLHPFLNLSYD